ncbi:hypothetical protein L1987_17754 [Smallanthus sonchifolius]|uniref:Uncharacterized protein n=1 Tax=Smallanthus sonchifolius TaxID=185202 RepID=A0ACB9IZU0_9ASTR|nr:hypothetical protein L1987_17754 [Smallanthus sonchifolius]
MVKHTQRNRQSVRWKLRRVSSAGNNLRPPKYANVISASIHNPTVNSLNARVSNGSVLGSRFESPRVLSKLIFAADKCSRRSPHWNFNSTDLNGGPFNIRVNPQEPSPSLRLKKRTKRARSRVNSPGLTHGPCEPAFDMLTPYFSKSIHGLNNPNPITGPWPELSSASSSESQGPAVQSTETLENKGDQVTEDIPD